jgi:hypothetical protein
LSQFPSFNEGFTAFGWVFDDVDDVTQVNDIGWDKMIVGLVVGVPTRADVSLVSRSLDITAMTAAIVEKCGILAEDCAFYSQSHRLRQVSPDDRGSVTLDFRGFWKWSDHN